MNKIKSKRIELGYKQGKIAECLGISTRHYARVENDERKPNREELEKLSKKFECEIKELI